VAIADKHVHLHILRHIFATEQGRARKTLRLVQEAHCHEDLTTTQIYMHIANEELEEAMRKFGKGKE